MEGRVFSQIHHNGQIGCLVKISTETDFASRTDEFKSFGKNICLQIIAMNPSSVEELLEQPSILDSEVFVKKMLNEITSSLKEDIQILEFVRFEV